MACRITGDPNNAYVQLQGGEFLRYTVNGDAPVRSFVMRGTCGGGPGVTIMDHNDPPPDENGDHVKEWHPPAGPTSCEHSLALSFVGALTYTFKVEQLNADGTLKTLLRDVQCAADPDTPDCLVGMTIDVA